MKPIQLVIGAVALAAAGGAGYIMMNLNNQPVQVVENGPQIKTKKVLVAKKEIPMGNKLTTAFLGWEDWPESGIREGFITRDVSPSGIKDFTKTIARLKIFEGEPIREAKVVRSDSGYMSAILPSGKRAVALRIGAESGAGGFVLPNDYVDVIVIKTAKSTGGGDTIYPETLLENIRVLAIDQIIEDKNGRKAKIGKTATLELTPEQVEIITAARQSGGEVTLSLRSVEDSGPKAQKKIAEKKKIEGGNIYVVRYGQQTISPPKK